MSEDFDFDQELTSLTSKGILVILGIYAIGPLVVFGGEDRVDGWSNLVLSFQLTIVGELSSLYRQVLRHQGQPFIGWKSGYCLLCYCFAKSASWYLGWCYVSHLVKVGTRYIG